MQMQSSTRSMRNAFTLVELLVVIGIIGVLVAILLPAMSKARAQANLVTCLSNIRQLGVGMNMYANDNKGSWPRYIYRPTDDYCYYSTSVIWHNSQTNAPPYRWEGIGLVYPYLKVRKVFFCPSDDYFTDVQNADYTNYLDIDWNTIPNKVKFCSYVLRGFSATFVNRPMSKKIAQVKNRALLTCYFLRDQRIVGWPLTFHKGKYPVLYGDGHGIIAPMPSWIDPKNPPDMWSTVDNQFKFYDSFDKLN